MSLHRRLILAVAYLVLAQCVSAQQHASMPDPARYLRQLRASRVNDDNLFDFANALTPSICGNTKCSNGNQQDCPIFSAFDEVQCARNGKCEYTPDWTHDLCNSTQQCGTGSCKCEAGLSDGCKCNYYGQGGPCNSVCMNGVCETPSGYIGDPCDQIYGCVFGVCSPTTKTCVFLEEGEACDRNDLMPCDANLYCSSDKKCQPTPPCSESPLNGTCPSNLEVCYNGTCVASFALQEGAPCDPNDFNVCVVGLMCIAETNGSTHGTCQQVAEGTPCSNIFDCNLATQACMCVEASDDAPKQCVASPYSGCAKVLQVLDVCMQNYCLYYDLAPGSECYSKCYEYYMAAICCYMCNNQEHTDNALFNYQGSCADNSVRPVQCCSSTEPCSVLSVADMCSGY